MENKNNIINMLKGMAIFLVLYGHVIQRTMLVQSEDFFLNHAFAAVYTFHMPLFFLISGYLMAFSLKRRGLGDVLKARCKSLLVPFVSWGILGVLTGFLLNAVDGKSPSGISVFHDFVDQLVVHPSLWFLFTLFALSAALLCSIQWERRVGILSFVLVYVLILIIPCNDFAAVYYIKWFYGFYIVGYVINRWGIKIQKPWVNSVVGIASFVLFLIFLSQWTRNDYIYINKMAIAPHQFFSEGVRIMYRYAVGFLGILAAFYIALILSKTKMAVFWSAIGIYSLDIYLVQRYILEGLYPRLIADARMHFDFNAPAVLYGLVPLLALFFTGACMMISKFLIRRSSIANKLLLGGRS